MGDHPRIQELRRRVEADPASIAFAQLAEEYRRAGQHEEAVRVSRTGLDRYPTYHSARVTLARALLALDRLDEARVELERVIAAQPDNLAALRTLSDIQTRRGVLDGSPAQFPSEHELAMAAPMPEAGVAAHAPRVLSAAWCEFATYEPAPADTDTLIPGADPSPPADPVLPALEAWLDSILADRGAQAGGEER